MNLMRQWFCRLASISMVAAMATGVGAARAASPNLTVEPVLESPQKIDLEFGGFLGSA